MSRTPSPDRVAEHLRLLREDPQSANPPGWRADFSDGPWPVKVHQGGERAPATGALARVLRGTVAVTAVRGPTATLRRAVPSGGAMHPTEAYVVLTGSDRLCHVDPYRLELLALPADSPTRRLREGLCLAADAPLPALVVLLTSRFWKNFYKYGDFSYRLGAVDAGVVLGRLLRLAGSEFGATWLRTDFADDSLNDCLGVDSRDESVYAVVGCGPNVATRGADVTGRPASPPVATPRLVERSRRVKRSPVFDMVHASARSAPSARAVAAGAPPAAPVAASGAVRAGTVELPPPLAVDLTDEDVIVRRRSGGRQFTGRPASPAQLATVLRQATTAVTTLRRRGGPTLPEITFCTAVHRVPGVPAGWYAHHDGRLIPVGRGPDPDLGPYLQGALFGTSVNAELAAFTVHAVASPRQAGRSARNYRTQQLAVGVAMEAVVLAATAVGLGNHPFLGFDAPAVDAAYGLDGQGSGAQAQICVGVVRAGSEWEVTVRPR
ncbi:nitroreductase family protein [Micromonospora sp. NPDC020750]|uniref:nitroreductase family protein n=1 Tax=unclassified Micromonospora TaxID=2617518 RepID=UPI00379439E1